MQWRTMQQGSSVSAPHHTTPHHWVHNSAAWPPVYLENGKAESEWNEGGGREGRGGR